MLRHLNEESSQASKSLTYLDQNEVSSNYSSDIRAKPGTSRGQVYQIPGNCLSKESSSNLSIEN